MQDDCLRQAALEEMEERIKEDEELNEVIDTKSYRDFREDFFSLRFIGYDYYPATHDGSKVYTFMNSKRDLIKVFSPQGYTIDQIETYRDSFVIAQKRYGCYEFQCDNPSFTANNSIIAFEDEWQRYKDLISKREQKEEAKRKQKRLCDIQEKRRNEFLFDFTDETALKESMQ